MTRKPLETSSAALPSGNLYAWPLGMVAVAAVSWGLMAAYQHMDYTCVAFRAMCEERERQLRAPVLATVTLPVPVPRVSLQLPPAPQPGWRKAEDGCPPHYYPINGACWIGVEEPPPCPTSYHYRGKCYAPAPAPPQRDGVSGGYHP